MKNEVRFYSTFNANLQSILEFAQKLTDVFKDFSNYDGRFQYIQIHLPKEYIIIDLLEEGSYRKIADAILIYNLKDIKKFDKVSNPTIEYKRPYGFSFGFNFNNEDKNNIFNLHAIYGGIQESINYQMNEIPIKQIIKFTYDWYLHLFKSLVKYLPINFAVLRPRDNVFVEKTRAKYKYPIGWITYFSMELSSIVPENMSLLHSEELENGKLFSAFKDEFCCNDEDFVSKVNKLYGIMDKIGELNPNYFV